MPHAISVTPEEQEAIGRVSMPLLNSAILPLHRYLRSHNHPLDLFFLYSA
jgi:hypothetical protein